MTHSFVEGKLLRTSCVLALWRGKKVEPTSRKVLQSQTGSGRKRCGWQSCCVEDTVEIKHSVCYSVFIK